MPVRLQTGFLQRYLDRLKVKPGQGWPPAMTAMLLCVCCISLLFSHPSPLVDWDGHALDLLIAGVRAHQPTQQVVIVDIDEVSLAKLGKWPWPKEVMAKLLRRLTDAGTSAVALDILLTEPEGASFKEGVLASALRQSNALIGFDFVFDSAFSRSTTCAHAPKPWQSIKAAGAPLQGPVPEAAAVICDSTIFAAQARGSGFLNLFRDPDGPVRRIPLLVSYREANYPSLALAASTARSLPGHLEIVLDKAGGLMMKSPTRQVALRGQSNLLLRPADPHYPLPRISAARVFNGEYPSDQFTDRLVVLGSSAVGRDETLDGTGERPLSSIDVQATAMDNLIGGDYFLEPVWAKFFQTASIAGVSLLTFFLLTNFSASEGCVASMVSGGFLWILSQALLAFQKMFISPVPALLACAGLLVIGAARAFLGRSRAGQKSREELAVANRFITGALGAMTAVRDVETGQHVVRIQGYVRSLCQVVAPRPRFSSYLTPDVIDLLVQLTPIHDIGKVGVSDRILRKPGPLDRAEFEQMKSHVTFGKRILEEAREQSGLRNELFFQTAVDIVYSHHEWWDGSGYPLGLKGDAIPLPGRLLAVADVYDALISKRHYKSEFLHAEAVERIRLGAGNHFDPELVEAFLSVQEEWRRMAESHKDQPRVAVAAG